MGDVRNVLFIMCDQLRWDHLSCYGHPFLKTRNLDALASRGVRFDRAFVAAGVCGPSRMSFYTGRYVSSHGATWNVVPLSLGELTFGAYLKDAGIALYLTGKTHMVPNRAGLHRLEIDGTSELGQLVSSGYFRELDRYDGHHEPGDESGYSAFLRRHGYHSEKPWSDFAISVEAEGGAIRSGWEMRYAGLPSRIKAEHSETAYMTDLAVRFIENQGDDPWVLHLSYIKPHWPYIAPSPYNNMYDITQCLPVIRSDDPATLSHPVYAAYREEEVCQNFSRDEVVRTVRPVYQGLIQQVDDELGRVWDVLERTGRWKDTLVIFTSDHGDYLGDHWLGEKELFHDVIQRVPLIIADPRGDETRGTVCEELVSAVDIVPTILHSLRVPLPEHRLEGRSLCPLLLGETPESWRTFVVSELDYAFRQVRRTLGQPMDECRAWMVRDTKWKYIHWRGFPAQLFDLQADPQEVHDLGRHPDYEAVRESMRAKLLNWYTELKPRITATHEEIEARTNRHKAAGVFYGVW